MKNQAHDPEWHLSDPRTRKWMLRCSSCGRVGYRADAPEKFFGRAHLIRYFSPITLDEAGTCDECAETARSLKNEEGA